MSEGAEISRRAQLRALVRVAKYKPALAVAIVVGGVFAALLEDIQKIADVERDEIIPSMTNVSSAKSPRMTT